MRSKKTASTSLAGRLPGFDARHATRRARRARGLFTTGIVLLVAAGATIYLVHRFALTGHRVASAPPTRTSSSMAPGRGTTPSASSTASAVSVTASASPFPLSAPIAGEVVLGSFGSNVVVIGGATTGGALASGAFVLDTSSGNLVQVGDLTSPNEGAAGAVIAGQDVVFGGTSPGGAVATVQSLTAPSATSALSGTTAASTGAVPTASSMGTLPQPRTYAAAATVGITTYLVGGDNGTSLDPQVLATTDGRSFVSVARLAYPVESAAVAATGKKLYVFGGQSISASGTSSAVNTIQVVDPRTHRARVVGHLPEDLCGASAAETRGQILVIGGTTVPGAVGASPTGAADSNTSPCGASPTTTSEVWWFDPSTDKVLRVATLPDAVSSAGTASVGNTVWVVGGDSNGIPVSAVQSLSVSLKSGRRR